MKPCFAKRNNENLIIVRIKVDVEGLVSSVETVIDITLRPHISGSLLTDPTKTVQAHF